jgi:hypothetical protein
VVDFILEMANISESKVSVEELVRNLDEEATGEDGAGEDAAAQPADTQGK